MSASAANLILVGAGAVAIPVLVGAGGISDRLGRKRIGCSFLALLAAGPLVALVIVAAGFPETAGRELEQTSAEPGGARLPRPIPAADQPLSGIRPRDLTQEP